MKVLLSGSSGLVGSALRPALESRGDQVIPLVRSGGDGVRWDPDAGVFDAGAAEGADAVVHLAGRSVATRWTPGVMEEIRSSRVRGTRILADGLAHMKRPPGVLVSASAIGFYGDRGEESVDESSPRGEGFLASVCDDWENATHSARAAGVRLVHARFGVVLSPDGGALRKMLPAFRLGLGGPLGSGRQWMSWVALHDAVRAIVFCLDREEVSGPVNVTAPGAVRNADFTRTLGEALRRPTWLPVPAAALRLAFGSMADETFLASAKVAPRRLARAGFEFESPTLAGALARLVD